MKEKDKYITEGLDKIGNRIKELRKKNGFTNYEQFAFTHEINRAQYGRYENGEDMRLSSFIRVLKALDVTWLEFFEDRIEGKEGDSKKKPKL